MLRSKLFRNMFVFVLLLLTAGMTGCGDDDKCLEGPCSDILSIEITPSNQSVAKGTTQRFMATGICVDDTTIDLTSSVIWTSADETVATISNESELEGLATALDIGGPITITATDPETGITGTARLTVTAATLDDITVTPANRSIALGTTQQFTATGTFSDLTTQDLTASVNWTSSNAAVATIRNAAGLNKGLADSEAVGGPITITATDPETGKTGTAQLSVTAATLDDIAVIPANRSIALGTTQQFTATGTFSDLTTQDLTASVNWTSSNAAVATISNAAGINKGLATSKAVGGPITITATDLASGKTGTAQLTVTAATLNEITAITITPANRSIALGSTQQYTATGTFSDLTTQDITLSVTWKTSNGAVATISNATGFKGLATPETVGGPITITATDPGSGKTGTAQLTVTAATLDDITVTPANGSIAFGATQQFTATGTYSDLTTQDLTSSVTWTSSDTSVATISNVADSKGLASAEAAGGPITITAADPATGKTGTAALTVTAVTPNDITIITITPVYRNLKVGANQQYTATATYSDLTTQDLTSSVTWTSSDTAVASINNSASFKGLASALSIGGPVTITATDAASGKTGTATLNITAATLSSIAVTPANQNIALGATQQFTAIGTYSDFTTEDLTSSVTWTSSDETVATISNTTGFKGLATPEAAGGPITITATDAASGKTGTAQLTVTSATLDAITVTPINQSIALGSNQQYMATGTYSDLTTQDLTPSMTWTSSDATVATISNADGFKGLATSLAIGGPITITATDPASGKTGTAQLTVTSATLDAITVTPVNQSIALGSNQQFTATGTYSDLTTQDLTSSVTWTSSDAAVATIDNAAGFKGLATSLAVGGPITITAVDPATLIEGTATLTVTGATLDEIVVTPANVGIPIGATQQFVATGTYSDLTTQDVTLSVTWTTTPLVSPVATISNAPGSKGLATALVIGGPITITATDPPTLMEGTAALTVTNEVDLGAAAPFGTFGGTAGMTNTGIQTIINGDIGTIATDAINITGFHDATDSYTETGSNIGGVTGTIYTCAPSDTNPVNIIKCAVATQARLDAEQAYLALAAMPSDGVLAGNLAGTTIPAGVYTNASSVLIQGGDLTLSGTADDVWVFQIGSTLTVGGPGAAFPQSIILAGEAKAKNVFWQVGTFATINAGGGGTMVGTIISQDGISFSTAGNTDIVTLEGRALSLGASVTMVDTVINVPAP